MRADRLVRVWLGATAAIVVAATAAELANYAFRLDVDALDSSGDGGAFGAVGDVALWTAVLAAWLRFARARRPAGVTVGLAVLLTFLALDKTFRLHDSIADWPLYYLPILCATLACLLTVATRLRAPSLRLMGFACALLAVSLIIHFTGDGVVERLAGPGEGWAYQLKAVIKHGSELAGWLIVSLSLGLGALEGAEAGSSAGAQAERRWPSGEPTSRRRTFASG